MNKKFPAKKMLLALLTLQLFFAIFWGIKKEGYYIDEPWSYGLANSHYQPFLHETDNYMHQWHEPDFYYNYVVVNEGETFDYNSVIYNQSQDVHPPIYYLFLHTICSFFVGTYSKWFGLGLNLFFYLGTSFVLYNITKEYVKKDSIMLYIPSFLYSVCAGGISTYLYIRMYMMLTFWGVLFLFLVLRMMDKNSNTIKAWFYLFLFLCTIAGTLTQYYFLIYAFFLSIVYCLWRLVRKEFKAFLLYGLSVCGGIGVSCSLFPFMLNHIFLGNKGQEVFSNASQGFHNWIRKMWSYTHLIGTELFGNIQILLLCFGITCLAFLFLLYFFARHKKLIPVKLLSIYILVVGYFSVISLVSNEVVDRYQFMIFPLIILSFWITLYYVLETINKEQLLWIALLLYLVPVLMQYKSGQINYLYTGYEDVRTYISTNLKEIPGIYITNGNHLVINNIFFLGEQTNTYPIRIENIENLPILLKESNADKLILYVDINFDEYETAQMVAKMMSYNEVRLLYDNTFTQIFLLEQ